MINIQFATSIILRSRFILEEQRQVAGAGSAYSFRTVSYILGCEKSTVDRYVGSQIDPLPITTTPRLGRPPKVTQDDIALTEHGICAHRQLTPINILPLFKEAGLVISESTLRRIMKKLGISRYVAGLEFFVDQQARSLRKEYALKHVNDGLDDWRRTI